MLSKINSKELDLDCNYAKENCYFNSSVAI